MRQLRFSLLFTTASSIFMSQVAFAAAFQLYELGTPIIGSAGVGQAAVAADASTAYFNPAGMALLQGSQYMLGSQLMVPFNNFSLSNRTTIAGNNGGNAGTLIPGLGLYYVYGYSPKLKFGVSFTSPYGGMLNYNDGWAGRYSVQYLQLYTLNLNPSLAYQFNDKLSVGAGMAVEYGNMSQTLALPITALVDGQASIKMNNTAVGFNLGMLYSVNQSAQLGIAYRSKITHDFHGDTTFLRISSTPTTKTKIVMPQNVIISLVYKASNKFSLLGDAGWANWSTMRNTSVTIAGYTSVTPMNWHNTYRLGVGGQYHHTPALLLQAGGSYDSSPTSSSRRTPDLPMDRQVRLGLGLMYSVIPAVKLGLSYEYINFGHANINNVSSNGALVGSYSRNYANVLQASINVAC